MKTKKSDRLPEPILPDVEVGLRGVLRKSTVIEVNRQQFMYELWRDCISFASDRPSNDLVVRHIKTTLGVTPFTPVVDIAKGLELEQRLRRRFGRTDSLGED